MQKHFERNLRSDSGIPLLVSIILGLLFFGSYLAVEHFVPSAATGRLTPWLFLIAYFLLSLIVYVVFRIKRYAQRNEIRMNESLNHQMHNVFKYVVDLPYAITDEQGRVIVEADTLRESYRKLLKGLQEVVKLAGSGAHFNAWLPSKSAYDVEGNKELGIEANTMLNYDVEIIEIKYNKR
jgi:Ca2+/Na+ antiporter